MHDKIYLTHKRNKVSNNTDLIKIKIFIISFRTFSILPTTARR